MWFKYSIKLFVCFCCFLLGSGMSYAQGIADISHLDYETRSSIQIACAFGQRIRVVITNIAGCTGNITYDITCQVTCDVSY